MADIRENGWEWFHYDNPGFQVQLRNNTISAWAKFDPMMTVHWHDDLEFIYMLKGSSYYEMSDRTVKLNKGEGIFVNARQTHLIHSSDEDSQLLCLIFHPVILCSTEYVVENYVKPLIENKDVPYVILKSSVSWQKKVLDDIAEMEQYYDSESGHVKVMMLIHDLWDNLFQNLITKQDDEEANNDLTCTKRMIQFIQKNYSRKIKLSDICKAGNVGKSKCNLLFAQYYNVSPIEYVLNLRIEQGARLLQLTDMKITDIAYETGFSDGSYFSKVFCEKTGCTPNKYRSIGRGMSNYYDLPESQGIQTDN